MFGSVLDLGTFLAVYYQGSAKVGEYDKYVSESASLFMLVDCQYGQLTAGCPQSRDPVIYSKEPLLVKNKSLFTVKNDSLHKLYNLKDDKR